MHFVLMHVLPANVSVFSDHKKIFRLKSIKIGEESIKLIASMKDSKEFQICLKVRN